MQPQDRIVIKGYRGKVEYIAKDNVNDITVTPREIEKAVRPAQAARHAISLDDWQLSVRRDGSVILISADGPMNKEMWGEMMLAGQLSPDVPEYDLTIVGPSRPTEISWHEGPIKVEGLNADLHVTTIKSA